MSKKETKYNLQKTVEKIKEPNALLKDTDSPYMVANVQLMVYDGLLSAIRKEIIGRFNIMKNYKVEDYESAIQDLNELLENFGK